MGKREKFDTRTALKTDLEPRNSTFANYTCNLMRDIKERNTKETLFNGSFKMIMIIIITITVTISPPPHEKKYETEKH